MSKKKLGYGYKLTKDGRCLDISNQSVSKPGPLWDRFGRKISEIIASNNMIKSADEFKKFINLQKLDISSNMIRKLNVNVFTKLKRLEELKLDHNQLTDVDSVLDAVSPLKSLKHLTIYYNPFVPKISSDVKVKNEHYHRFRLYIIYHLPQLLVLDNKKIAPMERKNAERTGKFCRVNRIEMPESEVTEHNIEEEGEEDRKRIRSYFGYTKKEYIGLNSQGNRFIKDL